MTLFDPTRLDRLRRQVMSTDEADAAVADVQRLQEKFADAVNLAEHLEQMIDPETWRATGGDDGQGHYEGDYRADGVRAQIVALKELAGG